MILCGYLLDREVDKGYFHLNLANIDYMTYWACSQAFQFTSCSQWDQPGNYGSLRNNFSVQYCRSWAALCGIFPGASDRHTADTSCDSYTVLSTANQLFAMLEFRECVLLQLLD